MQNNKLYSRLQILYICLVIVFVLTGCTKEDLSECDALYTVVIKAFDADNQDITNTEQVEEVKLYLFDNNNEYMAIQNAKVGETIKLNDPDHKTRNIVVWGNTAQNNQTMPTLNVGDKLETAFLTLNRTTKADLPTVVSPDDLFFGSLKITEEDKKTQQVISITRKTSGITVTARNLQQLGLDMNANYSLRLRKSSDKCDFYGKPAGEDVSYTPLATFNSNNEFVTPIFNILSTTSDIEIDFYINEEFLITVSEDNAGNSLKAVEGRVLNILIDFSAQITVDVSVTPWGEEKIWKEF